MTKKIDPINNGRPASPPAIPVVITTLKEDCFNVLGPKVREFFESCDDLFFDLANRAGNNNEQNLYFDAMRDIRLHKQQARSLFREHYESLFEALSYTKIQAIPTLQVSELSHESQDLQHFNESLESLTLVEKDSVEQDVAATAITSKVRQNCVEALYKLNQRMTAAIPHVTIVDSNNPLDPKQICECFNASLKAFTLDFRVTGVIFKHFEKTVIRALPNVYAQANEALVAAGFLPKIIYNIENPNGAYPGRSRTTAAAETSASFVANSPASETPLGLPEAQQPSPLFGRSFKAASSANYDSDAASTPTGSTRSSSGATDGTLANTTPSNTTSPASAAGRNRLGDYAPSPTNYSFNHLSDLMAAIREGTSDMVMPEVVSTASNPEFGLPIAQSLLFDELDALQVRLAADNAAVSKAELKSAIHQLLEANAEQGKPKSLEQNDEDVINLVSLFFDYVLDDPNLPVELQALMSRLQIPVLKVALKDKAFFNNNLHPARLLINEIADIGNGWDDSAQISKSSTYTLILNIVHTINNEFRGDCIIFETQLSLLLNHKAKEAKRNAIVEQRTNQAAAGKAVTDHARQVIQSILLQRMDQQPLPPTHSQFLIEDWQKVMMLVRLKFGNQSTEWLDSVQVVDDLTWIISADDKDQTSRRAAFIHKDLYKRIERGLYSVGLSKDYVEQRITLLQNAITQGNNPSELTIEQRGALSQSAVVTTAKDWDNLTSKEQAAFEEKGVEPEFVQQAEALKIGTWFTIADTKTGKPKRCKLSCVTTPSERFVFVNRFGQKTLDKSKHELALQLQKDEVQQLESGQLFDRVMDRIVGGLSRP